MLEKHCAFGPKGKLIRIAPDISRQAQCGKFLLEGQPRTTSNRAALSLKHGEREIKDPRGS
ncbi:MAG TPA: hypothetical protein DEW97_08890 [Sutterella wadsworthensis]|nr:hypothetical protein [Sutterella wadsworthensis]HCE88043.1 hypothetical protein [Sutterella wadsworthensis]HCG93690.1 hypothetical protein [Sutterella wadsworthensis]